MMYLGIDPGIQGAFAVLDADGVLVAAADLPTMGTGTQKRVNAPLLVSVLREYGDMVAACEEVGARPGQGVSSMFRFGQAVGTVAGVVAALGLPLTWVTSGRWKRAYGLDSDKERSRLRAIETWPRSAHLFARKLDHGRAEAALIAAWLRKQERADG